MQRRRPSIDIQLRLRYIGLKNTNLKNDAKSQNQSSITNRENDDVESKLPATTWGQFPDCNINDSHRVCHLVRFLSHRGAVKSISKLLSTLNYFFRLIRKNPRSTHIEIQVVILESVLALTRLCLV